MPSETKLTRDEDEESVDNTKYCGMIGSLLYLMASRPDIMFSVCLCACFQEDPKTSHLEAVKRIFRYIKGTTFLGLWYPKGTEIETIEKTALAISTTEAEYLSAGKAYQQALWMKQALVDYDIKLDDILVLCDNKGAIDLRFSPTQLLTTSKTTPPPLTSPTLAPSQPSKQTSHLAINLKPIELIFYIPPTYPYPFFDSLEDLPPRTTNLPPPQPSFNSIERLAT
ncbi:hypothetical protein Tco_1027345 [Tanacetum coccineum]